MSTGEERSEKNLVDEVKGVGGRKREGAGTATARTNIQ